MVRPFPSGLPQKFLAPVSRSLSIFETVIAGNILPNNCSNCSNNCLDSKLWNQTLVPLLAQLEEHSTETFNLKGTILETPSWGSQRLADFVESIRLNKLWTSVCNECKEFVLTQNFWLKSFEATFSQRTSLTWRRIIFETNTFSLHWIEEEVFLNFEARRDASETFRLKANRLCLTAFYL